MINIQAQMKELFGNSCYAYCIAYVCGFTEIKPATQFVLEHWMKGNIDNDGYVSQPQKIMNCKDVKKVVIDKIIDIPTEPTIIEMKCPTGGSHFIIGKLDKDTRLVNLIFDPAGDSASWKAQNFISYRRFVK